MADEQSEREYWHKTAAYYDAACAADTRLNDVPFYVETAVSIGGPVLEVGCGTGRVLLPTARAGVPIDGLDFSPAFLDILRAKLEREPPEVRSRVSLYEGDMRTFSLGKTYRLITVPFRPLQHLLTVEDQLAAFHRFNAHLQTGGRLAFNVFYPNYGLLDEVGEEQADIEWLDPADPCVTVRRSFLRQAVDKLNQVFEGEFIFRSYRGDRPIKEERSTLTASYYTYPHLLVLLKSTRFRIVEEYGSFEKEPISACKEMIFIAEKE